MKTAGLRLCRLCSLDEKYRICAAPAATSLSASLPVTAEWMLTLLCSVLIGKTAGRTENSQSK
jgi:hypothetical protein